MSEMGKPPADGDSPMDAPTSEMETVTDGGAARPAVERDSLDAGRVFRSLTIHSLLGRGAMGDVFLASHPILKTPLVVKLFAPLDSDIFREAHLAARIRSPYIVAVVDAGAEDGRPFVVQQYVDGVDFAELSRRLERQSRMMPAPVLAHYLLQLAHGIHEVHQAGVVHRDIKPKNLFLNGEGEALCGDFGIAYDPIESRRDRVAGTPPFVAPEIWHGDAPTPQSDIYALGATAHFLATGEQAFGGSTPSVVHGHLHREYETPQAETPAEAYLFSLVSKMLSKDPEKRPANMEVLARALAPIAAAGPGWAIESENRARVGDIEVRIVIGKLERFGADAVVSSAHPTLVMSSGVSRALREAGGEGLRRAAQSHAPLRMGDVVWTAGGTLPARWVAHAAAAQGGAICIQRCTMRVLFEAQLRGAAHVALPALGTGGGRVPQALAAKLVLETIGTVARMGASSVKRVSIVLTGEAAEGHWQRVLQGM
jgi:O-acetyl-ADP-ribose deacetylase (regulator of RNase III)